ncbi:MAG: ComEC/Rec2 family competence protein [Lachnospiraceae bacterium]|nr:ComEC/Rec2 family competence protein [Lachnospiraceae bacterium]
MILNKKRGRRSLMTIILIYMLSFVLTGCTSTAPETETIPTQTETDKGYQIESRAVNILSAEEDYEMTIHFIDVGQGLAILVQSDGKNLVYDGGDRNHSSFLVSYLKKQGVTDIEYLIASHYHEDHISGLVGCLSAFNVENVIGPDYEQDSKIYRSFIEGVSAEGAEVWHPKVGTEFRFGTGKFTILAPQTISSNHNDNSIVIKLVDGENSFLFMGDAEADSEEAMCRSGMDLDSDVLVLGHHGSATSTSYAFLQETVPEFAVISCGEDNTYGHPDKDVMDKLEVMEIPVYRTDKQGSIKAVSDGESIAWNMEPCNDYSPGNEDDLGTQVQSHSIR